MAGWSGAEIKTLCRQAKMLGCKIDQAERFVIPVSKTMGEKIENLRKWSEGRTIPASISVMATKPVKNGKRNVEL